MESCHLAAARRVELWSLNANLFLEEPHQLTKFAHEVHLNHIWQRTFSFKALITIFWDLQPLWSSLLMKPDLLRFKAGLHCDISISTSINISITNVHTCCISTRNLTYASAMSSRMKPRGYWTSYVFKMADEDEILLLLLLEHS